MPLAGKSAVIRATWNGIGIWVFANFGAIWNTSIREANKKSTKGEKWEILKLNFL
jgi:hypothetical protein